MQWSCSCLGTYYISSSYSMSSRAHPPLLSPSPGHSLTQFVRHCADHFLNSEHKEIRMEAARTCSRLLTPSIHLISGHLVSQTAVQVVADVLSKLLVVGITDPGEPEGGGRWTHTVWL